MKYLKFIFENNNIRQVVEQKTNLIEKSKDIVVKHNLYLENYIHNNLHLFMNSNSKLYDIQNKIREFVVNENVGLYNYLSLLLKQENAEELIKEEYERRSFLQKHGGKIAAGLGGAAAAAAAVHLHNHPELIPHFNKGDSSDGGKEAVRTLSSDNPDPAAAKKATAALTTTKDSELDSDAKTAKKALLDKRAKEIEARNKVREEKEHGENLEQTYKTLTSPLTAEHFKRGTSMVTGGVIDTISKLIPDTSTKKQ
jgi:hypothetical protein